MVVMAMTAIMISVTMVSLTGARERKAVESEARKFAAVVREAQNYALTGKQFASGRVTCNVGIGDITNLENVYDVLYAYRSGADCTASPTQATFVTNTLSNGVRFSSTASAFNFAVPRGETGLASTLRIQLSKGSATYSVCIYPTGIVEDVSGASCP
jgi:type II secretory pathway pseudopilin PulG